MARRGLATSLGFGQFCCHLLLIVHLVQASLFDCCSFLHIQSEKGAAKRQAARMGKYR